MCSGGRGRATRPARPPATSHDVWEHAPAQPYHFLHTTMGDAMRFRPTVSLSAVAALLITPPAGAQRLVQAERAWSRPSARRHASAPVPTMAPPPTAYELYSQTMMWGARPRVRSRSRG
jgi:hypothetical protein